MSLYYYVKKDTGIKDFDDLNKLFKSSEISSSFLPTKPVISNNQGARKIKSQSRSVFFNVLPFFFIGTGVGMLLLVIWPIVKWQLISYQIAPETHLVKPVPDFKSPLVRSDQVMAQESEKEKDLTKADNWFREQIPKKVRDFRIKTYTLSIPKLKIEDAVVTVGGEDLNSSLIQYEPVSLPGELGNPVIFGHSVLPEFFNPRDYHSIFATLPTIRIGDEILVNVDNVEYRYIVYDLKTVDPTDLSVLEQRLDNYYLSVVTCVPPGLKWKRLVVKSKLASME